MSILLLLIVATVLVPFVVRIVTGSDLLALVALVAIIGYAAHYARII